MVGILGSRDRREVETKQDSNYKGSTLEMEESAPNKSSSSMGDSGSNRSNNNNNNNDNNNNKWKGWYIGPWNRRNSQEHNGSHSQNDEGDEEDLDEHSEEGDLHQKNNQDNDGDDDDDDDGQHSKNTSSQQSVAPSSSRPVVETFPDSENEFHEVIRNQNWDLLEILLKEYDYKKYIKPPPPKKNARKLRVAKYLPEWKRPVEVLSSPLYGLDALGRAPLHLCCVSSCPDKPFMRLLFCARDLASVPDATGSLPLHLAVTHERSIDVVDKLIRGYHHGSLEADASGRTPLMWAVEMMQRQKDASEPTPAHLLCWGHPTTDEAIKWQTKQLESWRLVQFILENRILRRQKLLPREYRQIVQAMGLGAPPQVVSLFVDLGRLALKKEAVAGPALSLCISRQYPLDLLDTIVETSPMDYAKNYKDTTGRGVVAAHYRIGCVAHPTDENKRQSFRMIMQHLANAAGNLQDNFSPPQDYLEWWEKLKYLINLWGSYTIEDDASHNDFDLDDLLLHNALNNPDVPPSLIRLLAGLRPNTTDLEHPKTSALPIHLACRVWRYRHFPPRRGEKEPNVDKVILQLLEGDFTRTRKRYRDRLPIHHAVDAGKNWMFVKPLVVHDRKSLQVRDPATKLYPFQLAAAHKPLFNMEELARHQFTHAEWTKLSTHDQNVQIAKVATFYDLEQLSLIHQLLRQHPEAINHESIKQQEAVRSAARPKRKIITAGLVASEDVALTQLMKMIRTTFDLGNVSGHFIAWAYENTRRGWKTHRSNFGVLKEAIMDGLIPTSMDKWWRKLKYWIWADCPWQSPAIPRRDDFLLHGALCNPDTSPWIIDLLLECFPRSASIPLPGSDGCYPLHIACVTDRYIPLPFEFPNKRTIIEMTAKAYPDAGLLKWKHRLPLHLAIGHSKDWEEMRYLAVEEPVALAVVDPRKGLFPFQLMALNRSYNTTQRQRFEIMAKNEVGKQQWKALVPHERVVHMSRILEQHERNVLGGVWELLRQNAALVAVVIGDGDNSVTSLSSGSGVEFTTVPRKSVTVTSSSVEWMEKTHGLSLASIDFLDDIYERDTLEADAKKNRENSKTALSLEESISDPFLDSSYRIAPRAQEAVLASSSTPSAPVALDNPQEVADEVTSTAEDSQQSESIEDSDQSDSIDDYDYIEYTLEDDESVSADLTQESEYEGSFLGASHSADSIDTDIDLSTTSVDEEIKMGPYDHEALCFPRGKDIVFIQRSSAYVIWRTQTLKAGILEASSDRDYWAKVLAMMGEEVAMDDLHSIRQGKEQTFVAASVVEGTTIFMDEDDTYMWLLRGEDSCSRAENYNIAAAVKIISPLLDNDTGVWLEDFFSAPQQVNDDPHRTLDWILGETQYGIPHTQGKKFVITRSMLRNAFGHGTMNTSQTIADLIIDRSTRRLWFDIAKMKIEAKRKSGRNFIGMKFFIARKGMFERQRQKFNEQQKKVKFLKKLKKKQRQYAKLPKDHFEDSTLPAIPLHQQQSTSYPNVASNISRQSNPVPKRDSKVLKGRPDRVKSTEKYILRTTPSHLRHLNQPPTIYEEEDQASLDAVSVFDAPKPPPPPRPLLTAALKAKEQQERGNGVTLTSKEVVRSVPLHLRDVNQPSTINQDDDDASLAPVSVFDPPKQPPPHRPLLAAALKAKEQQERTHGVTSTSMDGVGSVPLHLRNVNQPSTIYEEDDESSLAPVNVFDPPKAPPPPKPLLTAALKAKEQQQEGKGVSSSKTKGGRSVPLHLRNVNQPSTIYEEDDESSLAPVNVFDPPKARPPPKPLLAAALKAKEQQQQGQGVSSSKTKVGRSVPLHLRNVNQPSTIYEEDDESSLAPVNVFDPPKAPPPPKPLLAAALKAKQQQEQGQGVSSSNAEGDRTVPLHLRNVNQPSTIYEEDDESSLAPVNVFDPPKAPPPPKPLLAAALKAKEQQEKEQSLTSIQKRELGTVPLHLRHIYQPSTIDEEDEEEASLVLVSVFDPPKPPPPAKPLLEAALKAKEERDHGIFKTCPKSKSILKVNKFGEGTTNHDRSLNLEEIRIGSPKRKPGAPRKVSSIVERVPVPMNAGLVRKNSMERFQVSKVGVGTSDVEAKAALSQSKHKTKSSSGGGTKSSHGKKTKNRPMSSSSNGEGKVQEPPPPPPPLKHRGSGSIMRLLGRRQKDTSSDGHQK